MINVFIRSQNTGESGRPQYRFDPRLFFTPSINLGGESVREEQHFSINISAWINFIGHL